MARAAEPPEELHGTRVTSGDVGGEFLQHAQSAGSPAVVDGLGDVQPLASCVQA